MNVGMPPDKGLGRIHAPDARDRRFAIEPPRRLPSSLTRRYWYANGWWGDQGRTSQCVGYSWAHWLEDGPVTHASETVPILSPSIIYTRARTVDEWSGEDYDGTSVRAGAKVLKELGYVSEYRWAFTLEALIAALLMDGPVVFGTNWYEGMFFPDASGRVNLDGELSGGHAYLLNGINVKARTIRAKNSWGRSWGREGHFTLTFEQVERLLGEEGEACLAIEATLT